MAKHDEPIAQLATRIPKELHRRLKLHCVTNDIAVMEFVVEALERRVLQMAPAKGAPRSRSAGLGAGGPSADRRLAGGVHDHRPHESRGSLTPVEFARRWRMENEARVSDLVDG